MYQIYALAWFSLLVLSQASVLAHFAWVALTIAPFLLADRA